MNDQKKHGSDDSFEDSLRQILTPGPVSSSGAARPAPPPNPVPARQSQTERFEKRIEAEQKTLFWFKLLRPAALIALLAFMALFVLRIPKFGN